MGGYLDAVSALIPMGPPKKAMLLGGMGWLTGAAASVTAGLAVEGAVRDASFWRRATVLGAALWPLFAHTLLLDEVAAVERSLTESVEAGRAAVSRIVSRDVSGLSEEHVRQAAIESLAENLSDSVVAPLFWFAVGGLPAVALYRFCNTADAKWGYRTPRWRHAGTVAARADDLLNLIPARLTGLMLWRQTGLPYGALQREACRTPSPNAGWPMAAMALRLGIRLEKLGVYSLGMSGRPPMASDTRAALRLARRCGWAAGLAATLIAGWRGGGWRR
jgi:adenosylcobinamide-phosphate synthase